MSAKPRPGWAPVRLDSPTSCCAGTETARPSNSTWVSLSLAMTFEVLKPIEAVNVEVGISAPDGTRVVTALSSDDGTPLLSLEPGTHLIRADLELTLLPGDFTIDVGIHPPSHSFDFVERALSFEVINVPFEDTHPYPWPTTRGVVRPLSRWFVEAPARAGAR